MKLRFIFLVLILITFSQIIYCQEINQLKDYFSNSLYNLNPAAAGYNGGFITQLSFSKNWTDVPGSPECQVLSNSIRLGEEEFYDPKMFKTKPILNLSNHASLGFTVYNETEGPLQHTGFMAAYAYHIYINDMRLSLGLAGMLTQYNLNTQLFKPADIPDPDLYNNNSAFIPEINFGVMLYNRLFYSGISFNGLKNFKKIMDHQQTQPDVVLFAGNKFILNEKYIFEPSLFLWKYGNGTYSADINAKMYYKDNNWLLFAYHGTGEIIAGIGIGLKQWLQLGYTYNINTSGLSSLLGGSQNITLIANIAVLKQKNYSW